MEVSKVHDISILHLFGEVSLMEMDRIETALRSFQNSNSKKILIDMASVDYVHYFVIKRLVKKASLFREDEGDIKLVSLKNEVKEMIRFTGADQFLEDYATISEAILSYLKPMGHDDRMYH
ncbi:MAG: STAS domain-containing protein [Deltaproteobacteria bacterium]|nr:STAS domain-containing protein [Deltaproteobacteria bacterium]